MRFNKKRDYLNSKMFKCIMFTKKSMAKDKQENKMQKRENKLLLSNKYTRTWEIFI